jgi:hypothetical protein
LASFHHSDGIIAVLKELRAHFSRTFGDNLRTRAEILVAARAMLFFNEMPLGFPESEAVMSVQAPQITSIELSSQAAARVQKDPTPVRAGRPAVSPVQAAPKPPKLNLITASSPPNQVRPSAPGTARTIGVARDAANVQIPDLNLRPQDITWRYVGRVRHVDGNIGSPQHVHELTSKIPKTAQALFGSWARAADVYWEVMYNLTCQGVGPEDPSFRDAFEAALNQRVADQDRASSRAASSHAFRQRGSASGALYGPFVTEVVPRLFVEMNRIYANRVTELCQKYDIALAQNDDGYKAVLGHLVFKATDTVGFRHYSPSDGLALPEHDFAALTRDAESLKGCLGRIPRAGLGVFRAGFDTKIDAARQKDVAVTFGRLLVEAGIKPHDVELEIVPEY